MPQLRSSNQYGTPSTRCAEHKLNKRGLAGAIWRGMTGPGGVRLGGAGAAGMVWQGKVGFVEASLGGVRQARCVMVRRG